MASSYVFLSIALNSYIFYQKQTFMSKTNPIGVRFDAEQLEFIKKKEKLESPQQVVYALMNQYCENNGGSRLVGKKETEKAPVKKASVKESRKSTVKKPLQKKVPSKKAIEQKTRQLKESPVNPVGKMVDFSSFPVHMNLPKTYTEFLAKAKAGEWIPEFENTPVFKGLNSNQKAQIRSKLQK